MSRREQFSTTKTVSILPSALRNKQLPSTRRKIKATKDAMLAWTLVGIKLKVVKDVRKLIAKLIWDAKEEALYDVSERHEQEEQKEQEEQEPAQEPQPSARALRAQKRARK
jgi:hypothetical protein